MQLIDGGLHDNQGIAALIDAECTNMIISDASGQLPASTASVNNIAAVFYRADSILQERLRELQFKDIKERESTTQLSNLVVLHLKNGLQQQPKSWLYCTDPPRQLFDVNPDDNTDLTKYGILRTVQNRLSEIRTDLDSFNDIESYALMYSGWCQTKLKFNPNCNTMDCEHTETGWKFLGIKNYLTQPEAAAKIDPLLSAAKYVPFKLWYLSKTIRFILKTVGILIGILLILFLTYHVLRSTSVKFSFTITAKALAIALGIYLIGLFSKFLAHLLNFKKYAKTKLREVLLVVVGFLICWLYVIF